MSFIELDSVSFSYPAQGSAAPSGGGGVPRRAVDGVSLRIRSGEYLALVGPNGSGKSTLLRLIAGLLAPVSGSVRVLDLEASDPPNHHRVRSSLALVFQSPLDQIVSTVVEEDVAFGPENLGLSREEIEERVTESLQAVGLLGERRRPSLFLSAGQQQRLALAGALAMRPRCIAFDEATSMLDPPSRRAILELLDELRALGTTILHVTHDMEEAARADRILVMSNGSLAFDGPPEALFGDGLPGGPPLALALGLELPPVAAAARAFGLAPAARESLPSLAARVAAAKPGGPARSTAGMAAPVLVPEDPATGRSGDPPPRPALEAEALSFSYLRGTSEESSALRDIDLSLPRGASLALVGRTGSGKSSLLQLLGALATPSTGRLRVLDVDPTARKTDLAALRVRTPLAIQRPESALFEDFAGDDAAFGPRNLGLSGSALVERVSRWMGAVGLPYEGFRDRRTRSLSGGEKRRLALAGVLALEPEVVLLDEPTQALDPVSRHAVLSLIEELKRSGKTVVLATHSMDEAAACDFVAVFAAGQLQAYGPPQRIFGADYDPAWGIGRPFACALAGALADQGVPLDPQPLSLRELVTAEGRARRGASGSGRAREGA